jgi:hypothetical protein
LGLLSADTSHTLAIKTKLKYLIRQIGLIVVLLTGILLVAAGVSELVAPPIRPGDIAIIGGNLAAMPEINSYRHTSIMLRLKEYPGFVYAIKYEACDAAKVPLIRADLATGDSITIGTPTKDYKDNVANNSGDHTMYTEVYTLQDERHDYISLGDYCKEVNSNKWVGIVSLALGCLLSVTSIWPLLKKKRRS